MRVVCSYCEMEMARKEPFDPERVSHGICNTCLEHFKRQWEGLSLGEYLDRFPEPVLAVDANVRTVAANQAMADLLGRQRRDLEGLLGGDVLECRWARRPEGCGKTEHCTTCTVRRVVEECHRTGGAQHDVNTWVVLDRGQLRLRVSAMREEAGYVRLTIEEASAGPEDDREVEAG
jgi:PAS domain-containing protein